MLGRIARWVAVAILIPAAALAQAPARKPTAMRHPAPAGPVHFDLAPVGNAARFVVREQLMTATLPNDAVGVTHAIAGGLTFAPDGKVDAAGSVIVVRLDSLATDNAHRDTWIKEHTLRTDSFPTATMVVRQLQGLPSHLPTSGSFPVKLLGDLTIHGVTRPWTWDVNLVANGNDYTGTATTHLKFGDFGMTQPRLLIVVSVIDDVRLEFAFHFVRSVTS